MTAAVVGNPNCGKTTVFNLLTGARQTVGNWPGVTVERISGKYNCDGIEFNIVDLPGIYSLSASTLDEKIAEEFIKEERPDLVINVVDASNLTRNLYLTVQLMEAGIPFLLVLNMMDKAGRRGLKIDPSGLSRELGCPVVCVSANRREALPALRRAVCEAVIKPQVLKPIDFSVCGNDGIGLNDSAVCIADKRYRFITSVLEKSVRNTVNTGGSFTEKIDRVVLNRYSGIPLFFAIMYITFFITINLGGYFINIFDSFFGTVFVDGLGKILIDIGAPNALKVFLADGLGAGIQTIATFVPPIFLMFFCLTVLEDSGYMARAAVVMDRLMRAIGLGGKAFVPMLIGFGCNVPAILATRTLESRKDRIITAVINPFMSCGARMPVYALFTAAFFPDNGGLIVFSLYAIGIIAAVLTALLLKNSVFKKSESYFIMELPDYHAPVLRNIMMHAWLRLRAFIFKAGKAILAAVFILGVLNSVSVTGSFKDATPANSVLSYIGRKTVPIFKPMGISDDNWPAAVGLFTGVFAKEAVIGTLNSVYSQLDPDPVKEERIYTSLARHFDGRTGAYAYLLFVLLYFPCVAAVAAIYKELGLGWALFSCVYQTTLAWTVAVIFYQAGKMFMQ